MNASSLLMSLVVSAVGYVAFVYGKRQRRIPHLVLGMMLMVFPYFVDSALIMLAIASLLVMTLWLAVKLGW